MLSHKDRIPLWRFVAANNLSFTIKKCCSYYPQQTVISSAANSLFVTLRMLCHMAITNFGFKSKFNEKQSEMICWADVVLSKAVHTQHSKLQIVGTSFDILSVAWCVWRWVRVTSSRVLNDQNFVIPAFWHSVSDSVWLWMPECHAKSSGQMEKYFM